MAAHLGDVGRVAHDEIDRARQGRHRLEQIALVEGDPRVDAQASGVSPGHEQSGEELVADELRVDDGPLRFEFHGNCGYAARFDYRS